MTAFLASVRTADEARIVLDAGADIIDAKEPQAGALGAVSFPVLARIRAVAAGRKPLSATIGDSPMQPHVIADAVAKRAAAGADYVKFGVFDAEAALISAKIAAQRLGGNARLIAVFFADQPFTSGLLTSFVFKALQQAGLAGIMLDTAEKASGRLLNHFSLPQLGEIVKCAHNEGLMCGLAGSLLTHDIPALLPLKPDYLGFRGALCGAGQRNAPVSPKAAAAIRMLIPRAERSAVDNVWMRKEVQESR